MNAKLKIFGRLCLTTALVAVTSPALAGFEWNPPPAKASAPTASPSSVSTDPSGPLMPMPGEGAPIEPVDAADIMDNGTVMPRVTELNAGTSPVVLQGNGDNAANVEGFGKDIPLAVALRQVVPPAYNLSFATGLDQGKPVSWSGGRPWIDVVNDMLNNRKLHASLNGNTILISEGLGSALTLPPSTTAPAMMADNIDGPTTGTIDMTRQSKWEAAAGQSLHDTLATWSRQANVELAWQGGRDFPISSAFTYEGTFDQAVDSLLSLYSGGANEPMGKLYPNLPQGPSVLVIGANN